MLLLVLLELQGCCLLLEAEMVLVFIGCMHCLKVLKQHLLLLLVLWLLLLQRRDKEIAVGRVYVLH
jgi:hypothetical protein